MELVSIYDFGSQKITSEKRFVFFVYILYHISVHFSSASVLSFFSNKTDIKCNTTSIFHRNFFKVSSYFLFSETKLKRMMFLR